MKKILVSILAAVLLTGLVPVCSFAMETQTEKNNDAVHIVATIFPEYDWVMNVLGENPADVQVSMLLDNGVDLHSYQPTVNDIIDISTCDIFIYVGGESDKWVNDALNEAVNKEMIIINLLEALGDSAKEEEIVEGMQEEEHEHENAETEHDEEAEYDEHVWLSLKNASSFVEIISEAIQSLDPENSELYKSNTESYIEQLRALDDEYKSVVTQADKDTVVFADRFPFRYLTDDYGLSYFAAFAGCSAETEASFQTVIFLAQKMDELSLGTVLTIEGTDHRIAETVVQNTKEKNQQVLTMNSLQSVTSKDVSDGVTYLSSMKDNLDVLAKALE